jgi:hypothetical protein
VVKLDEGSNFKLERINSNISNTVSLPTNDKGIDSSLQLKTAYILRRINIVEQAKNEQKLSSKEKIIQMIQWKWKCF